MPELELDPDVVRGAKALLRKQALSLRGSMPRDALARRSEAVCTRLLEEPAVRDAACVALFWPMSARAELDLRAADTALRARGVRLAYPAVVDAASRHMIFRLTASTDLLVERGHRFQEPPAEEPEASALDVVVVPALGYDPRGQRIGYGAGYYDRALARVAPSVVKIGVGYDFELAVELPVGPHDVPVDWVITDTRVLAASR